LDDTLAKEVKMRQIELNKIGGDEKSPLAPGLNRNCNSRNQAVVFENSGEASLWAGICFRLISLNCY